MRSAGAPPPLARRLLGGRTPRVAAALVALALAAPAAAQAPAAPPAPAEPSAAAAPATPPRPQPIPLADVARAAERASDSIASITEALAADPRTSEIEAALPARREHLAADSARVRGDLAAGRSLRSLAEIEMVWRGRGDTLRGWVDALGKRVAAIQDLRDQLAALEDTWQATLASARAEQAPADLLERIAKVIADTQAARATAKERAAAALTLQGAAADLARQADAVVVDLRSAREATERQLFEPEQPPLWAATRSAEGLADVARQARESVARDARMLRHLEEVDWRRLAGYGALLLLSLPLTFALRARSRGRRREGRSLGAADRVFDYPISIAVLATLPLAWWWVLPHAPPALLRLFSLLVWIPIVRVLRRLLPPGLHPALYALAAFYVIDRVRDVLDPAPLAERALFALELALAIALLVRLLRPQRLAGLAADVRLPPGAGVAMRAVAGALAVALLANLLGYVDLSRAIGETLFGAGYLAVLLFAVARVLQLLMLGLLRTPPAKRMRVLQRHRDALQRRFARIIGWVAGLLWLWGSLRFLGVRDALFAAAQRALAADVAVGSLRFSAGDVVAFAVTLWLAFWVSRILRVILEDEVFPRASLGRGVPQAISAVAQYAVLMVGFLLAAAAAGFDWSRITLLAGAFGVGIGFGLQNVVNNFVSGLILLFERPVQVGDTVQQGELVGEVRRIGIRSSTVRTAEGAEVIVPNGDLISQRVVNWTLSDRNRRIDLAVGVAYGTAPERVLALLERVGRAHPDTLADPEPLALLRGFGESSLDFELRIWSARPERMLATRSELAVAVLSALVEEGIEVPFPQRDLRLVAVADAAASALAGAQPAAAAPASASPAKR